MGESSRNESVSVGAAAVSVSLPKNGRRAVVYLTNTGATTITVCMSGSQACTAGAGIVLLPGGFISDSVSEGYMPYQGEINAIGSGAGGTLGVYERIA